MSWGVGGKPREGFIKVRHSSPMLSLDNALNESELRDFDRRVRELLGSTEFRYVAELKLEDARLIRVAAHRLQQAGELDLAISLFERVQKLRNVEWRVLCVK